MSSFTTSPTASFYRNLWRSPSVKDTYSSSQVNTGSPRKRARCVSATQLVEPDAPLPTLPREVIDRIIIFSELPPLEYATISKSQLHRARKAMLQKISIEWPRKKGPATTSQLLLAFLDSNPSYAQYVKEIEIYDEDHDDSDNDTDITWGSEPQLADQSVTEVSTPLEPDYPGHLVQDEALRKLLVILRHVETVFLHFRWYDFDYQQYDQLYPGVLSRFLDSRSIKTLKLKRVKGFPLAQLEHLTGLVTLSMAGCSFAPIIPSSTTSRGDSFEVANLLELNMCELEDLGGIFASYIASPLSRFRFTELQSLVVDARTPADVACLEQLMDVAADSLEFFELCTKHMEYEHPGHLIHPFDNLPLSKLKFVRSLDLWLNFRPICGVNQIDWFLKNMKDLPVGNHLRELEITLDMAHETDGKDRAELDVYDGWARWEEIFASWNLQGLCHFTIVLSSSSQELNYRKVGPGDSIHLPRLKERLNGDLVYKETWDFTTKRVKISKSFWM